MTEIPHIVDFDEFADKPVIGHPGWFCPTQDGRTLKPIIRCYCGTLTGIRLHHVHADGTVTASFHHKRGTNYPEDPNGCDWHVFLKLKDYDQGEFLPGE